MLDRSIKNIMVYNITMSTIQLDCVNFANITKRNTRKGSRHRRRQKKHLYAFNMIFPDEIRVHILSLMSDENLLCVRLVCRKWNDLVRFRPYSMNVSMLIGYHVRQGHANIIKHFFVSGSNYKIITEIIVTAIQTNNRELIDFFYENHRHHFDSTSVHGAVALHGNLDLVQKLVQQLRENGAYYAIGYVVRSMCVHAATGGHLDIIKWLSDYSKSSIPYTDICQEAAYSGHKHILEWIPLKYRFFGNNTFTRALFGMSEHPGQHKYLETFEFVLSNVDTKMDLILLYEVARSGKLKLIENVLDKCGVTEITPSMFLNICRGAASAGHLELFQWAWKKR